MQDQKRDADFQRWRPVTKRLVSPVTPGHSDNSNQVVLPVPSTLGMSHSPLPSLPPLTLPSLPIPVHPPISPLPRTSLSRFASPTLSTPPPAPTLVLPDDVNVNPTSPGTSVPKRRPRLPVLSPSPRLPSALPPSASPRVLTSPPTSHFSYFNTTSIASPSLPLPTSHSSLFSFPKKRAASDAFTVDESEADSLFSTLPIKRPRPLPSPSDLLSQPPNSALRPPTASAGLRTSSSYEKKPMAPPLQYTLTHVPLEIPPGVVTGRSSKKPPKNPLPPSPATAPGFNVPRRSPGVLTSTVNAMAEGSTAGISVPGPKRMPTFASDPRKLPMQNARPNTTGGSGANNGYEWRGNEIRKAHVSKAENEGQRLPAAAREPLVQFDRNPTSQSHPQGSYQQHTYPSPVQSRQYTPHRPTTYQVHHKQQFSERPRQEVQRETQQSPPAPLHNHQASARFSHRYEQQRQVMHQESQQHEQQRGEPQRQQPQPRPQPQRQQRPHSQLYQYERQRQQEQRSVQPVSTGQARPTSQQQQQQQQQYNSHHSCSASTSLQHLSIGHTGEHEPPRSNHEASESTITSAQHQRSSDEAQTRAKIEQGTATESEESGASRREREEADAALLRLGEVTNDPLLCGVCGTRFARKSNRLKHVRSVHSTERRFKCHICSYAFKRQDHLHKHIASVHEKRRNFKCTICQAAFAEKFNLKKHIKTVHFKHSGLPALTVNQRTAMALKFASNDS